MNDQVTAYIAAAPAGQQEILTRLRSLIHETVKGVTEEIKWGRPVYKLKKNFAYLQTTRNHVNLGFMDAGRIDDPAGLLEGTGKGMRHIKLKTTADIDSRLLKKWLADLTSE